MITAKPPLPARVSCRAVPALLRWLQQHGLDTNAVLHDLHLDGIALDEPDAYVTIAQFVELWRLAAGIDPAVGLKLIDDMNENDLHLVTQIFQRSRTLRDGLDAWQRYARLVCENYGSDLVEEGDGARYVIYCRDQMWECRPFVEHCLVVVTRLARIETRGGFSPSWIGLRHPKPAYAACYVKAFDAPVFFSHEMTEIAFPRAMLQLPLASHAPYVHHLLRDRAEERLLELDRSQSLARRVRQVALRHLMRGGAPTLDQVAAEFRLSPAMVQRQLRSEGVSWRTILEDTRREMVSSRLLSGAQVTEIAAALGYSEPAALHHAIRRWFGMTAAEFRAKGLAESRAAGRRRGGNSEMALQ